MKNVYTPVYEIDEYSEYIFSHEDFSRTMASTIRYPTNSSESLPVIVVSHGGSFNDTGNTKLQEWGKPLQDTAMLSFM